MKTLLSYLLLAAFTFTACSALSAASDKANQLHDKDDVNTLLKSLAASQDEADKDGIKALLKELAASQQEPDEDDINSLLKQLAASQDDTTDDNSDDDDNDDDLTEIQAVFDVMDLVKQEEAMAMQDDDDNDDGNAENQWISAVLGGAGRKLLKRYGGRYLRRYAWNRIRRAGKNYIRRRYCNEKEAMLQELNDEAGDDDDADDTTFAELQSMFGALKELKAVTAKDKGTASAEGFFSRSRRRLRRRLRRVRRRIGRRIRTTIRRRFC
jgi:hypothetical protein